MAGTPKSAGMPRSAQSAQLPRDRIAEALYSWCRSEHDVGHVFTQDRLLESGIIPDRDIKVLLTSVQYLTTKNLFRTHDFRGTGGIGWELVSQERAQNYSGLTRDEHLVFQHIDAAGSQGIWVKTLQKRIQTHQKVLERTYKSLESKGRIRLMKSVKYPARKMYIVAGLTPSEDATGGAWFQEGKLDTALMSGVTMWLEKHVSDRSWVAVRPSDPREDEENIVKAHAKGKGKRTAASIDDDGPRSLSPEVERQERKIKRRRAPIEYMPHPPGYHGYPTINELTNGLNASEVTKGIRFPPTAIAQLLEVMVYDEQLYKLYRDRRSDEHPIGDDDGQVIMFRCYQNPGQLERNFHRKQRAQEGDAGTSKLARRQMELEEIGRGGASEVPCLRCPAFDLCGEGGPVNVVTCPYFDEWYLRAARADGEAGAEWADSRGFLEAGLRKRSDRERTDALALPQQMIALPTTVAKDKDKSKSS